MKIVIFGANGPTGRLLTKQALAEGHAVTAVTRHPEAFPLKHACLQVLGGDVYDLEAVEKAVTGQDAVLSTLGVPFSRKPIRVYSEGTANIVQAMLGKSEAACRRSFSRAKPHLRKNRPRFPVSRQTQQQLLDGYIQAVETGEMTALMNLLSEDVVLWTDSGGKTITAAFRPINGRDAVARFILGTKRFWPENYHAERADVNGQPAMLLMSGEHIFGVLIIDVEADQIQTVRVIVNPDKLARV